MGKQSSLRPLLSVFVLLILTSTALVWLPAVAAQSPLTTASPTDPVGPTGGVGLAPLGLLLAALIVGGLVIGASAGVVSIGLIELGGPFSDRTHVALPVAVGGLPTAVLVNSFGLNLLLVLVVTEVVALPVTGLLIRRRYSRTRTR